MTGLGPSESLLFGVVVGIGVVAHESGAKLLPVIAVAQWTRRWRLLLELLVVLGARMLAAGGSEIGSVVVVTRSSAAGGTVRHGLIHIVNHGLELVERYLVLGGNASGVKVLPLGVLGQHGQGDAGFEEVIVE